MLKTSHLSIAPSFRLTRLPGSFVLVALAATSAASALQEKMPVDYSEPASWLCLPDRDADACDIDLDTSVVAPDGTVVVEPFVPHPSPPVDCFYVYPTVSNDPGGNSDLVPGVEERGVIAAQAARFRAQCRVFAPLYRQITLTALLARMGGGEVDSDRAMAFGDIVDAWRHYLAHHNQGRGVVLIGHSQGSGMLRQLLVDHIEGKPQQDLLVSAMLIGTNILTPTGADQGATFRSIPLCRTPVQTGCVVSFVTFRDTVPPPAESLFGRSADPDLQVACTHPAALLGGAVSLRPYINSEGVRGQTVAWAAGKNISTPFVTTPGLLEAECVVRDGASILEIRVRSDPDDPRADDIPGDVVVNDNVVAAWGLHLVDMHVTLGDLVSLVGTQARAFVADAD